ncbi:LamG-like jellyroll fold domain-containing protein [Bacteroidota bacterium]
MILGPLELNAQLIQHLDAGEAESVLKDSTELIVGWNDLSGVDNNAVASKGKVYYHNSNPEDGRAWIDFGDEQNSLQLFGADSSDNWLDQSTGNAGFCVLLSFKITRIIGNWNDLFGNSSAVSQGFGLRYGDNGNIQAYLGGKTINKNGENLSAGDRVVYAFNYNAITGSYEFWDSKNNSSVSGTIANMDFSLASPVTLGATSGDARYFDGMVGEVKIFENSLSQEEFFSERQKLLLKWVVEDYETEAPTPNPASFSVPPKAISGSLVAMCASTGSDSHEPVVLEIHLTTEVLPVRILFPPVNYTFIALIEHPFQ